MSDLPKKPAEALAVLDERARQKRERVMGLAKITQDRLKPAHVAQEAGLRALELATGNLGKAKGAARANQSKLIGAATLATAVVGRKRIGKLIVAGASAAGGKLLKRRRKGKSTSDTTSES